MKGTIVLNGNIEMEADFIRQFKDMILSSNHTDPHVKDSKKALLITAAWRKNEFQEDHVKEALRKIGIPSIYKDGYDKNIQNLAVYHEFNVFREKEPELYRLYHEKQENIIAIKEFYRSKNAHLVALLKNQTRLAREQFPETSLARMMDYNVEKESENLVDMDSRAHRFHYFCRDIQHTIKTIIEVDNEMIQICQEIDDYFFKKSNIAENPTYREIKEKLEKRILSSNSIFIFGGHVAVLLNRLNFFKLKGAFLKALARGTNFYTVSAGSDVLCDKIILYGWVDMENPDPNADFEFFDNGFGLITKLTVFPHCHDRIKHDDPDTMTYLANRFKSHLCVGLDRNSFLKLETYLDEEGKMYERYVSIGKKEGVYVFNRSGKKTVKTYRQELEIPGSKMYETVHYPWKDGVIPQ